MRLLSLAAVASLAVATPGCMTTMGAGTGAFVAAAKNSLGDSTPRHRASAGMYALVGAAIGVLVDIMIVEHALKDPNFLFGPLY